MDKQGTVVGEILPVLKVSEQEWWGFEDFYSDLGLDYPPVFSCNDKHEVWPTVVRGYHYLEYRRGVQGKNVLLDRVVRAVVKHCPDGKRFLVQGDGAYLLDGGQKLFGFEIDDYGVAESL